MDATITLIHRRDHARGRAEEAERNGQVASALFWRCIEAEALNLAAFMSDDQWWAIEAEQKRAKLEHLVVELDTAISARALPQPYSALAS